MLKKFILFLFLSSSGTGVVIAQNQESDLKAVFIYNFPRYVEWDTSNLRSEFVIGVIGQSPVTKSIQQIAKTKTVKNKKISVRIFNKPEEIEACHMLFIPQRSPYGLHSILSNVKKETLTISEQPGYSKMGTAFNLIIVNEKLKFEANLKALDQAGLKAGSQLLKLAIIVD